MVLHCAWRVLLLSAYFASQLEEWGGLTKLCTTVCCCNMHWFCIPLEISSPGTPSLHCAEELSACRDMHTKHTKAGQQELLRSSLVDPVLASALSLEQWDGRSCTNTGTWSMPPTLQPHWNRLTDQSSCSADMIALIPLSRTLFLFCSLPILGGEIA